MKIQRYSHYTSQNYEIKRKLEILSLCAAKGSKESIDSGYGCNPNIIGHKNNLLILFFWDWDWSQLLLVHTDHLHCSHHIGALLLKPIGAKGQRLPSLVKPILDGSKL